MGRGVRVGGMVAVGVEVGAAGAGAQLPRRQSRTRRGGRRLVMASLNWARGSHMKPPFCRASFSGWRCLAQVSDDGQREQFTSQQSAGEEQHFEILDLACFWV